MSCLNQALECEKRGWSVIPVGMNKRPIITWKEFQKRRATKEEIAIWWAQNPNAQIGIVTGEISDLTVIDVEFDGDFNLIKDKTFTTQTGGGGRHYYFKYEKDFTNMVRVLPSVDVRSEGGYVVGAGSETEKGGYSELNDLEVGVMSKSTKEELLGAKQSSKRLSSGGLNKQGEMPDMNSLDYKGYGEGLRNDAMTRYIGAVLAKIHPSLWDTMGWETVFRANQKNSPPLPESELLASFNSIKSREITANPSGRESYGPKIKEWGASDVKAKNAGDSDEEDDYEPAIILHASEAAKRQEIDTDVAYPIDMKSFDDALLGGFSPGELIVVAGKTGCGKTTIMQDWTVKFATGGMTKHDPLPALWFSYEVLVKPLWNKFISMGADETTPIYLPSYNESGNIEWVIDMINSGIDKEGIKVVAIDHLGFLKAPKGNYANSSDAITHTVRELKRLAVKKGIIIMLPVHMRKTHNKSMDTDDIKDSSGIGQEADTVFFIDREKEQDGAFKQGSRVGLIKNRKTGISVIESIPFFDGNFYYNKDAMGMPSEEDEVTF